MCKKIKLYANTVKYLKPSQIYYRFINIIKNKLYKLNLLKLNASRYIEVNDSMSFLIPMLDYDHDYLNRFDTKDIFENRFTFINITNESELSKAWNNENFQHLWRYNLHYFEYLYKLAYDYSKDKNQNQYYYKFRNLILNWIDNNPYASGDGWHPYTISLRLTNWISVYLEFKGCIKADKEFDIKFKESLYLQYLYLLKNPEKDVLGNHYFENIKALIICSIYFDEDKVKDRYKAELLKELDEQILHDGMHFELSPMYHNIILEDLIKITYWLRQDNIYTQLITYIQKMINVTYSFEDNFGKTPAFNDSANCISKGYNVLVLTCEKYFSIKPQFKGLLEDSGFFIIKDQFKKLIFDTGEICPRYLPAHGHCDALSFELSVNNKPLFVNSGTFKYEKGEWRNYFRSTKAHNTVTIEEQEQSQCWDNFRVANRIKRVRRKRFDYKGIPFYSGAYLSFKGNEHKRFIGLIGQQLMIVIDFVSPKLSAQSYLHFAPEVQLSINKNIANVTFENKNLKIIAFGVNSMQLEQGWYSEELNIKENNKGLIFKKDDHQNHFGYLIDFGSINYRMIEKENQLRIIEDKELIISFNELDEML